MQNFNLLKNICSFIKNHKKTSFVGLAILILSSVAYKNEWIGQGEKNEWELFNKIYSNEKLSDEQKFFNFFKNVLGYDKI